MREGKEGKRREGKEAKREGRKEEVLYPKHKILCFMHIRVTDLFRYVVKGK